MSSEIAEKSLLFKLILSQMVYEMGEDFAAVASAMNKHPLLTDEIGRRVTKSVSYSCEQN
jgi:hypothetical protein